MATAVVVIKHAALAKLLASPQGDVSMFMLRTGIRVSNQAKANCPVDTGRLRASIGVSQSAGADGAVTTVQATADYAIYVHEGTRYTRARPFLRDALNEVLRTL